MKKRWRSYSNKEKEKNGGLIRTRKKEKKYGELIK